MVTYLSSNSGDMGLIPGWRTKISKAVEHLSLRAASTEPGATTREACALRRRPSIAKEIHVFLNEKIKFFPDDLLVSFPTMSG